MNSEPGEDISLCPVCLERIPFHREFEGLEVYQVKQCPEHGSFRTLIWQGPPEFDTWRRPKIPAQLAYTETPVQRGCPFDCGLCPEHRQRTCSAVMDVAHSCDLGCPICYAGASGQGPEPSLELIESWYQALLLSGGGCNIQLSGGEPTIRDDLPDIVAMGRELGFDFIQINTHGLRLARDRAYGRALVDAGLASVFLQFDAVEDTAYRKLRGRPLLKEKLAALEACAALGLGVVLVPTLVRGINLDQVGPILSLAQEHSPFVRAVHFQPMSRFGRYPASLENEKRLTLPELMRAIDQQSEGRFPLASFRPPGCENSLCSFQGNFLLHPDGRVQALSQGHDPACCPAPEPAEQGALRTIARVSRNWAAPASPPELWAAPEPGSCSGPIPLDEFITLARQRTLSVSAMAFQDAWNLDLERVRDCCIHQVAPDGRRVPFCLYNLTSASGQRLYRP
ncbi:MAG: radical SAM protein [Desulfarculaceae bacterium]|nr:radical SAM protein [Desulfarculaceae bacterium]MCF8074524.1 radical SAM protein [Desulfarculaceae bacterium]MCF8103796.1 radical SAM protein [Desulfarculaceae bacterium]MCF8118138.1 radical SAM protein [Desulfarculaceae bacterium]